MAAPGDNIWVGDLPPECDEASLQAAFGGYGSIVSCRVIPPKSEGRNAAALVRFENAQDAQWVVENLNGNIPEGFEAPVIVQFSKNSPGSGKGGKGEGGGSISPGYAKGPPAGGKGGGYTPRSAPYGGSGGGYAAAANGYGKSGGGSWSAAPQDAGWGGGKGGGKSYSKGGGAAGQWRGFLDTLQKGGLLPGSGTRPDDNCVYVKNLPADVSDLELYQLFSQFGAISHRGVTAMMNNDGSCHGVGFVDFQDSLSAAAAVEALNGQLLPDGTAIYLNLKRSKKGKGEGKGK